MTSEKLKKWVPIKNIPNELYLDDITDDFNGLTITLRGENSDDAILIQFGLFSLSYQSRTETCVLKSLDDYLMLKSAWPLFIDDDSSYIDWLVKQSYNIIGTESKAHYIIKHADGIIDIVSTRAPEVKWI